MDTSDPEIIFDHSGRCNHCVIEYFRKPLWFPNDQGRKLLDEIVYKIKKKRNQFEYDIMIGLSGGVDSSYLAYFLKKL